MYGRLRHQILKATASLRRRSLASFDDARSPTNFPGSFVAGPFVVDESTQQMRIASQR